MHLQPVGTSRADPVADAAVIDVECVNGTDARREPRDDAQIVLVQIWSDRRCWLIEPETVAGGHAAATNEIGQGAVQESPISPGDPHARIDGFRQVHFGMSEEQARQAIRKDFPAAFGKLTSAIHPSEKTTVLSLTVTDLLPHSGDARISYIFGYRSKKLIQVNVVWTSDGNAAGDETVVGTANALRNYFLSQKYQPDSVVANREITENTILVFRANDAEGRTVLLLLTGVAAAARKEKKGPQPPLTLQLSYIQDAAHPDVFRIAKGQF
jgi:hypothetical protein